MLLSAVYLVITALAVLLLLAFLLRGGVARPMTVWGLSALLPLLAALSVALTSQARAAQTLASYHPQTVPVVVETAGEQYDAVLSARQAACLERAKRLQIDTDFRAEKDSEPIPLRKGSQVTGELPTQAVVEALGVKGQLSCPEFRHVVTKK